MMPPEHPPVREGPADFHYHTYNYAQPVPARWTLSDPVPSAGNMRFYSMARDIIGLRDEGLANEVPNVAQASIGLTAEGRDIRMLSFGNRDNDPNAPVVLITGGVHAREWVAAEFAYLLAEYLMIHYTTNPRTRYQKAIKKLVDTRRVYIIPMLNPDGNRHTVFTANQAGRLWRKNRRPLPNTFALWQQELTNGAVPPEPNWPFEDVVPVPELGEPGWVSYRVPNYDPDGGIPPAEPRRRNITMRPATGVDLNRNYQTTAWGYSVLFQGWAGPSWQGGNSIDDTYFGTRGGREAETASVTARLVIIGPVAASIDYHSYGKFILYPSEAFNTGAISSGYKALGMALRQLVHTPHQHDYQLGSPRRLIGYDATGSITDHLAQQYHARAFTIELDPALADVSNPDAPDGFLLPEDRICGVFEKNIRGALALLAAPNRHAVRTAATTVKFLTWNVYGRGNRLPE
jgi:hypothetical protein